MYCSQVIELLLKLRYKGQLVFSLPVFGENNNTSLSRLANTRLKLPTD